MSAAENIPWEERAIGAEEVGVLLGLSARTVKENVACRPDFPARLTARPLRGSLVPRDRPTCFDVDPATKDAMFRRARDAAQIKNLHFHDSRAEAIWRLSKKLDVMELARMIGHRDIRSLLFYYNTDPDELADRL